MIAGGSSATWYRNRFVWAAVILAMTAGAVVLVRSAGAKPEPADLQSQVLTRMRTILEQTDPGQHRHAGHNAQQAATGEEAPPAVVCGVHVYGYEPAGAATVSDVQTVYAFHMCGVAEQKRPWDVAVKLAGPVIVDLATDPPGIQVVEATADVRFVDRLQQMFPAKYAQLALKEALADTEMANLRRRYDAAAGL